MEELDYGMRQNVWMTEDLRWRKWTLLTKESFLCLIIFIKQLLTPLLSLGDGHVASDDVTIRCPPIAAVRVSHGSDFLSTPRSEDKTNVVPCMDCM